MLSAKHSIFSHEVPKVSARTAQGLYIVFTVRRYSVPPGKGGSPMVARKPFFGPAPSHPELDQLLEQARRVEVTDEQLREQRVSFAYGNAPEDARITKESVRDASNSFRIKKA